MLKSPTRLQVVAFYPVQATHWGEHLTLTVCPQRTVFPERLVLASQCQRDYAVERLSIGVTTVGPLRAWPALRPPMYAALEIRARYVAPARPWLRGSRAARKAGRVRFWRAEQRRKPCTFYASLICQAASS